MVNSSRHEPQARVLGPERYAASPLSLKLGFDLHLKKEEVVVLIVVEVAH